MRCLSIILLSVLVTSGLGCAIAPSDDGARVDEDGLGSSTAAALDAKKLAEYGIVSTTMYDEGMLVVLTNPKIVPKTITLDTYDAAGAKASFLFEVDSPVDGNRVWYASRSGKSGSIENLPSAAPGTTFAKWTTVPIATGGALTSYSTRSWFVGSVWASCVTRKPPNPLGCI